MIRLAVRRLLPALLLPLLLVTAGCDLVTAEFRSEETSEWRKTYPFTGTERVEISNVNGKIDVRPGDTDKVEVIALKKAKGPSPEAAKAALDRIHIVENVSSGTIKLETKVDRGGGPFNGGGTQVEYRVRVPAGAEVKFTTVNGGVDATLDGSAGFDVDASTVNGGVSVDLDGGQAVGSQSRTHKHVRSGDYSDEDIQVTVKATTVNGGVDVEG